MKRRGFMRALLALPFTGTAAEAARASTHWHERVAKSLFGVNGRKLVRIENGDLTSGKLLHVTQDASLSTRDLVQFQVDIDPPLREQVSFNALNSSEARQGGLLEIPSHDRPLKLKEPHIMKYPELKVKVVSLAAEARIIRNYERRIRRDRARLVHRNGPGDIPRRMKLDEQRQSLELHRKGVVRYHARYAQLAYGFLRGVPYRCIENTVRPGNEPDANEITRQVKRFDLAAIIGSNEDPVKAWLEAA